MQLPTQGQVNAAARNIASAIGGAVIMFGLSSKVDINTVNSIITATSTLVNDALVLAGIVGPILAAWYASRSANPNNQAAAVGASESTIVQPAPGGKATITITDPEMAKAALEGQKAAG